MAAQSINENYLRQVDALSRCVTTNQRNFTEEDQACLVIRDLLDENEKEYQLLKSEFHHVQTSITEQEQREQSFQTIKSLQSTLIMLGENSFAQQKEVEELEGELEMIRIQHDSLCQTFHSKLVAVKARLAGNLVEDTLVEKQMKRDQLFQQKVSLMAELTAAKENRKIAALNEWRQFKEAVVKLASVQVKLPEEVEKVKEFTLRNRKLETEFENLQREKSAAENEKQKQEQQKRWQQQQEEREKQQREKHQLQREPQKQPQQWQLPQGHQSYDIGRSSNPVESQTKRQDTPRPKQHLSLSFSLPKLQFPTFGEKRVSKSLGELKKGGTGTGDGSIFLRPMNCKVSELSAREVSQSSAIYTSRFSLPSTTASTSSTNVTSAKPLSSTWVCSVVPASSSRSSDTSRFSLSSTTASTSSSSTNVTSATPLSSPWEGSVVPMPSSDVMGFSTVATQCSNVISLSTVATQYSSIPATVNTTSSNSDTSGYLSASANVHKSYDSCKSASDAELSGSSQYFEKVKKTLTFAADQDSPKASTSDRKARPSDSSVSVLQSSRSSDALGFSTVTTQCSNISFSTAATQYSSTPVSMNTTSSDSDTSGYLSASANVHKSYDSSKNASDAESSGSSQYFKNVKKSLTFAANQDSPKASTSGWKARPSDSSVSVLQSEEFKSPTSSQDSPGAEVWSTPPSSPALPVNKWISPGSSMSLPDQESRKAYISSLLKSPELVYGKAPPPVKYATRGPKVSRSKSTPSIGEDSSTQPLISHRPHVEDLAESGEVMETSGSISEEFENATKSVQPMDIDQSDLEQHEIPFTSSQGFSLSDDLASSSQQAPSDYMMSSPGDRIFKSGSAGSSMVVELPSSMNMPSSSLLSDPTMNFSVQSGDAPSGPPPMSTSSFPGSSTSSRVTVSQTQATQQVPFNRPKFCSSPKSFEMSTSQVAETPASESFSLSVNVPSPIYSNLSAPDGSQYPGFAPPADNSFSSLFATRPSSSVLGGGALNLFGSPPEPSQRNEPERGTSGVSFSMFGESQPQRPDSPGFFTFGFGGGSNRVKEESSNSGGFFSMFGPEPPDDNDDAGARPNFKLF